MRHRSLKAFDEPRSATDERAFIEALDDIASTGRDPSAAAAKMADLGFVCRGDSWYLARRSRSRTSRGEWWSIVIEIACAIAAIAWCSIGYDIRHTIDRVFGNPPSDPTGQLVSVLVFIALIYGVILSHAWRNETRGDDAAASVAEETTRTA